MCVYPSLWGLSYGTESSRRVSGALESFQKVSVDFERVPEKLEEHFRGFRRISGALREIRGSFRIFS